MQDILNKNNQQINNLEMNQQDSFDQQGQDLFNQIQLDQTPLNIRNLQPQPQLNADDSQIVKQKVSKAPIRLKKNNFQIDSDQQNNQQAAQMTPYKQKKQKHNKSKKKKMSQKKLKKKNKKALKRQKKLRKLKQQGEEEQNNQQSQKWSGESSESSDEQSDVSKDSLLEGLNPSKRKIRKTEKKQGFSLKQLGNDPQIQNQNKQDLSDSQFSSKNKKRTKKTKVQKKEVIKNSQILQILRQKGICDQQQKEQSQKNQREYDNGLQQVMNMKNSKKKGPKIVNKLFQDMQLDEKQEKNEMALEKIQLQIKPKVITAPSLISQSFLSRAQKIKRARGIHTQSQINDLQKVSSFKARQSMAQLVSRKQLKQADEIQLDIKVPQIVKGNGQINNSIFLKKLSSTHMNQKKQQPVIQAKQQITKPLQKLQPKTKLSRFDFFKSINQQLKERKSREVTNQLIASSFKVTQLEQIQDMRKKNQAKRRRQALIGSDDDDEQFQSPHNQQSKQNQQNAQKPNKLSFMNQKIQAPSNNNQIVNQNNQTDKQNKEVQQKQLSMQNVQSIKQKQIKIVIKDSIPDQKYRQLLRLEEGLMQSQGNQEQQQNEQNQEGEQKQNQNQNQVGEQQQNIDMQIEKDSKQQNQNDKQNHELEMQNQQQNEEQQINNQQLQSAQRVDLQVDLQVSNQYQQQSQQQNDSNNQLQVQQQPVNQQYQQYLNQLQAQGINLKKNKKRQAYKYQQRSQQKQNIQLIENNTKNNLASEQNQDRKQFRKLRKIATIIKKKQKAYQQIKKAVQFYDQEAEEGSDNQQHDGQVKLINDDDQAHQYEGLDLDAELQQLIDNAVDIDQQNEELAFRKYQEDVKIQDREQLRRIIKGDFKRRKQIQPLMDQMQEDEKKRIQRMEQFQQYIKKKQNQQGKQLFMENQEQNQNQDDQNSDDDRSQQNQIINGNKKQGEQLEEQVVDDMNEQNLKRYLDDGIVDNFRTTTTIKRPKTQLPQSYQRIKKTSTRNNIKPKQITQQNNMKLKKTSSSRLNQMIMKNKETIKPIVFMKNFSAISIRR